MIVSAGPVSFVLPRRTLLVTLALGVVLLAAMIAAISIGTLAVPPLDVVRALLTGGTDYDLVVRELRWPRVVLGAACGAAFGLGGALIQSVARNPLSSPDVIGVTQGAGLAATIALTSGLAYELIAPAAMAGGLLAAVVVFAFGARTGFAANRFVLAGVAVAFALRAGIEVVMSSAETIDALRAQIWLIGSLNGRGYEEAGAIGLVLLLALPLLLWAARALRTSALDDDTARALGARPAARRLAVGALGVVLAAAATAQVGAVDFVALVAPQVARRLSRAERPPLAASALAGAALVVLADLAARMLLAPTQLPVGVLTAGIGGPYLVYLLIRRRR
ncbi:FecCD family ABC transporter permease [Catellatospora citrea]|uniref:ABC transporter permease n=1 Tax=Catellatospora citrea TaxID=53366 RepID=A0A8J3KE85_9ACTN|nr:iron ABC transporter permease [Catellatospora citrea]RKE09458.1 iron complex transport system permease protein [Catellatospora citrea]GIF97418.1 ABC transporter permease [Catellatospora citrea]